VLREDCPHKTIDNGGVLLLSSGAVRLLQPAVDRSDSCPA
jgi:hypothetical protein